MIFTRAINEQEAARIALEEPNTNWTADEQAILEAMQSGSDDLWTGLRGSYRAFGLIGRPGQILTHEASGGINVGA